ncbi:hypothetical protein BT63DRAFT_418588 [Microthyrium microscopicum]|uniref:Uncharacterized protein n=1 Tax=Microthyrium microscopicum TaxID=703497 RepID=A0A6A6TXV5_9PEZI|nr:hypothetical protein BT63DRAFT_418588 [Microthyrium microscopicum]
MSNATDEAFAHEALMEHHDIKRRLKACGFLKLSTISIVTGHFTYNLLQDDCQSSMSGFWVNNKVNNIAELVIFLYLSSLFIRFSPRVSSHPLANMAYCIVKRCKKAFKRSKASSSPAPLVEAVESPTILPDPPAIPPMEFATDTKAPASSIYSSHPASPALSGMDVDITIPGFASIYTAMIGSPIFPSTDEIPEDINTSPRLETTSAMIEPPAIASLDGPLGSTESLLGPDAIDGLPFSPSSSSLGRESRFTEELEVPPSLRSKKSSIRSVIGKGKRMSVDLLKSLEPTILRQYPVTSVEEPPQVNRSSLKVPGAICSRHSQKDIPQWHNISGSSSLFRADTTLQSSTSFSRQTPDVGDEKMVSASKRPSFMVAQITDSRQSQIDASHWQKVSVSSSLLRVDTTLHKSTSFSRQSQVIGSEEIISVSKRSSFRSAKGTNSWQSKTVTTKLVSPFKDPSPETLSALCARKDATGQFAKAIKEAEAERSAFLLPENKDLARKPQVRPRSASYVPPIPTELTDNLANPSGPAPRPASESNLPKLSVSTYEPVEAWAKFPSHTRPARTGSASDADKVLTRDFAYNGNPVLFRELAYNSSPVLVNSKPKKMARARKVLRNYREFFSAPSLEYIRYGLRRRTSVDSGGEPEDPDLD